MARKKRIGQTCLKIIASKMSERYSLGRFGFQKVVYRLAELSRDAGIVDKHYFSVVIKTRQSVKEIHYQFQRTVFEKGTARFEQSTRSAELILK